MRVTAKAMQISIINDLPFLLLVYQQGDISYIVKYPLVITNHQIQSNSILIHQSQRCNVGCHWSNIGVY